MPEPSATHRAEELHQQLARLERELDSQRLQLAALRREMAELVTASPTGAPPASTQAINIPPRRREPIPGTPLTSPAMSAPPPPPLESPLEQPAPKEPAGAPSPYFEGRQFTIPAFASVTTEKPGPHRSVENRIGSQLFNRIGIIALLIGVALALKFAYDQGWLHVRPIGRIVTGLLLGAGVVLWSERFRRKGYGAFSYSMKAVGTGTLYLTLWASFQIYHLLPAPIALAAMIAVTAWNAAMAWMQDSELLAVYALVGGFASPALSSGGNHESFLFTYVLAIDLAVLFLLTKKPWQRLLLGSFPATVVYFIGWYSKFWSPDQAFVTALFAVLLSTPFVALALVGRQRDDVFEGVLAPFGAASFLSLALYSVLEDSGRHSWLPWEAVALAALYLLLMRVRRHGLAEPVHLALAVVFLIIAVPLKASGRWITIGWLAEGDALVWVATRMLPENVQPRVHAVMRWLGTIALALGVAESLIFWSQQDAQHSFLNARFTTELAAVAALALAAWLTRTAKTKLEEPSLNAPEWPALTLVGQLTVHLLAPLAICRELAAYWTVGTEADAGYRTQLAAFSITSFLMVYAACLFAWIAFGRGRQSQYAQRTALGAIAACYLLLGAVIMLATPTVGSGAPPNVFFNERVIFQLCGVAALALCAWFARLAIAARSEEASGRISWPTLNVAATLAANVLAALAGAREIAAWWTVANASSANYRDLLQTLTVSAWVMLYGAALIAWLTLRAANASSTAQRKMLTVLASIYLGVGLIPMLASPIVSSGTPANAFWNARLVVEFAGAFAIAATARLAWRARAVSDELWVPMAASSFVAFNLLVILAGVHEIFTYFGLHVSADSSLAESFSISAWLMVYATVLLAAGFWKRMAFIRWQGLLLMVFTIVKVFLYDMHSLSSGYRILSFFGLGLVLMVVSFAYQKDWLHLRDAETEVAE